MGRECLVSHKRFSSSELHRIRNGIPVGWVIEHVLSLPSKKIEGVYRFLCPVCSEFQTGVNPQANLARCFRCKKNFNPIELVMAGKGLSFVQSVYLLRDVTPFASEAPQPPQGVSVEDCAAPPQRPSLNSFLASIPCACD